MIKVFKNRQSFEELEKLYLTRDWDKIKEQKETKVEVWLGVEDVWTLYIHRTFKKPLTDKQCEDGMGITISRKQAKRLYDYGIPIS